MNKRLRRHDAAHPVEQHPCAVGQIVIVIDCRKRQLRTEAANSGMQGLTFSESEEFGLSMYVSLSDSLTNL